MKRNIGLLALAITGTAVGLLFTTRKGKEIKKNLADSGTKLMKDLSDKMMKKVPHMSAEATA